MTKPRTDLDRLVDAALAIEAEEAKKAGALGFTARAMTMATLPHRAQKGQVFQRRNGSYTMTIQTPPPIGIPYGAMPRLLLAWLTTEAVRTKSRDLVLGDNLTSFMRKIGVEPVTGKRGNMTSFKRQAGRLFASHITCIYNDKERTSIRHIDIADGADLWWQPISPAQQSLWESQVTLTERFYNEVTEYPIPVDLRALKALKRSPMALDIYCWLTYRMSYLGKRTVIPWAALQAQFGADYQQNAQGRRDFKKAFLRQLHKVTGLYPDAKVEDADTGLLLKPSPSHIKRIS